MMKDLVVMIQLAVSTTYPVHRVTLIYRSALLTTKEVVAMSVLLHAVQSTALDATVRLYPSYIDNIILL